jgi:hypothetical protein
MAEVLLATAGPGTWIVPAGVTSIQVECWGGGGSGAYRSTSGVASGGGGGGYSLTNAIAVTPGQTVHYSIGAGGAAASGSNINGNDGGQTWLNVSANTAPASTMEGCLAVHGRRGQQASSVSGQSGIINSGMIGNVTRTSTNSPGAQDPPSASGGGGGQGSDGFSGSGVGGSSTNPEAQGGRSGVAGSGLERLGGAGGQNGVSDVKGGSGGGGTVGAPLGHGGDGGFPGGGGSGGVTPATRSGAGGGGQIRITYTAALTAAARRVAVVMM